MDLKEALLNGLIEEIKINPSDVFDVLKRILVLVENNPELQALLIKWLESLLVKPNV